MLPLFHVIVVSSCILHIHSFVLLQVRKQNDTVSKIDALIHKLVPNDKVKELKQRFTQRAVKSHDSGMTGRAIDMFSRHKKTFDRASNVKKFTKDNRIGEKVTEERSLESVVLSGVKNMVAQEKRPALVDNISKKILNFVKERAGPIFRSRKKKFNIKPEIIDKDGANPSVMVKLDSDTVFGMISSALNTGSVQILVDHVARGIADAYRRVLDSVPAPHKSAKKAFSDQT